MYRDRQSTRKVLNGEEPSCTKAWSCVPGACRTAMGGSTVLTVCIPRGVLHDIHELEWVAP